MSSFWTTAPGVLTAIGGLIGAVTALLTALYKTGIIGSKPAQAGPGELTRGFIIGRWQVDQVFGEISGESLMDYREDGTCNGKVAQFQGDVGKRVPQAGHWKFIKLTKDSFQLEIKFDNGAQWTGTFKILDQDHIHNIDENYVAMRIT